MKFLKRFLLLLIFLFAGAYLYLSWSLSNLILFPNSSLDLTKHRIAQHWGSTFEQMTANMPEPESFILNSFDGTPISGKYFHRSRSKNCAIIFAHGWTGTWAGMLKYVPVLSDCNCNLVMYDHRSHGESGGVCATGSVKEAKDLLLVTQWVQNKTGFSDQQIGWVGASWGGAIVLKAGADKKNVAFIIADAPFQDWYSAIFERAIRDYGAWTKYMAFGVMQMVNWRAGIDYTQASPLLAASQIEEPVLLIHSQSDSQTGSHQSVNISKYLNQHSTFHHLDWGGEHTRDVLANTQKFKTLVNEFLMNIEGFTPETQLVAPCHHL